MSKNWAAVVAYIERQMHGRTGAVTLHFAATGLKRIEVNTTKDASELMSG